MKKKNLVLIILLSLILLVMIAGVSFYIWTSVHKDSTGYEGYDDIYEQNLTWQCHSWFSGSAYYPKYAKYETKFCDCAIAKLKEFKDIKHDIITRQDSVMIRNKIDSKMKTINGDCAQQTIYHNLFWDGYNQRMGIK